MNHRVHVVNSKERIMIKFPILILAVAAFALPAGATTHEPARAGVAPTMVAAVEAAMSEGEVRKVDMSAKKITIKHGELRNLDMPAMTMVFQVADPALLGKVKTGDKVKFRADKVNGAFTVMEIEPVK
jgi:Cu(I)/Ag(I) efflux system periplasmic protein CusF